MSCIAVFSGPGLMKRPHVEVHTSVLCSCVTEVVDEEEEMDCFPFDLDNFVTVDEVGDVADLPDVSSLPELMETDVEAVHSAAVWRDAPAQGHMQVTQSF